MAARQWFYEVARDLKSLKVWNEFLQSRSRFAFLICLKSNPGIPKICIPFFFFKSSGFFFFFFFFFAIHNIYDIFIFSCSFLFNFIIVYKI
jgi:hypothetical protein